MRGRRSANSSDGYCPASIPSTLSSTSRDRSANVYVRRTSFSRSSTVQSSAAQMATICCASTSRGFFGTSVRSISPLRMRSTSTAHSSRSPRNFGKMRPTLGASTWCPARPTRWSPRATDFGDSTWMTRSTAPISMPSSNELVQTSPGSSPAFSRSSMSRRCSRETDPWCARRSSSPAISFRRAARRSARRRLFTKISVDVCAFTSSSNFG